jgi:uncharacterized membrane protein
MTTTATALQDWLLFAHVLAAMLWLGGLAVLGALGIRVVREGDADATARFLAGLRRIGPVLLAPAPVVLVAFGVWLVADSDAWGFGQLWVQLGLGLFAAAFAVGAAHQARAALGAERSAARGDAREAARLLRGWAWGMGAIALLLVAATWDMVFKPGL